jgi:hypothetical protein
MSPAARRRPQDQEDGAKPGTAAPATGADKHAFNADERASTREAAAVTIGEVVYHRRRKNWKVTRELRTLLRTQERAAVRQQRIGKQIDALDAEAPIEELEALEAEQDRLGDESDEAAYGIIGLLLRSGEGESPSIDSLKDELDVEDAGDLAALLAGGGEPDPTPATGTTSD